VKRSVVVGALGTAQTLAWGSSYYLPAILADPIARGVGVSRTTVFGLFSGALLLSALLGPAVGRAIDNRGGRGVLTLSNLVLATGLVLLGAAQGFATLALAWAVLGVGMAMGLYDPAFATLTGLYGRTARGPITGITLIAGFASTIGWPLSAFLDVKFGWRAACLIWAVLHILIGLPLNRLLIPRAPPPVRTSEVEGEASSAPRGAMPILAFVFATTWFVTGAMAAHLPRLLEIAGASTTVAIAASALVGPAQVAARVVEFGALRTVHPLVSARLAAVLHPIGAVILALMGPGAITVFTLLHGAGNGLLTIAKGTVPLAIFGPVGYGLRSGILGAPARATQAASPLVFGLLMDHMGLGVLAVSAGLSLSALVALLMLRARSTALPATAQPQARSPMPDVPGQENCRCTTDQASKPTGAKAQDPGGDVRRSAELVERDAKE
jgi:MFS family permease